jgi:hypothetical protein
LHSSGWNELITLEYNENEYVKRSLKMKNEKYNEEKKEDAKQRDDEMAEGKSPHDVLEIYKKGGKYYCAECHAELPFKQNCVSCHKHIDWDRIKTESM